MLKVSETVRSVHGRDGAVVLDVRRGQMFDLNLVGSKILELLKNGCTEAAIVDRVIGEFGVSRELAEGDVREFIRVLGQNRLVQDQDTALTV